MYHRGISHCNPSTSVILWRFDSGPRNSSVPKSPIFLQWILEEWRNLPQREGKGIQVSLFLKKKKELSTSCVLQHLKCLIHCSPVDEGLDGKTPKPLRYIYIYDIVLLSLIATVQGKALVLMTRINNNNNNNNKLHMRILASAKTSEFNFSGRRIDLPESPVALPAYLSFQALFSASFMKPNYKPRQHQSLTFLTSRKIHSLNRSITWWPTSMDMIF